MIPRRDKIENITFGAGAFKTRELPKTIMRGLEIYLLINHTYVSSAPTIIELCQMVTSLELTVNGRDSRIKVPMWFLYYMYILEFGQTPIQSLYTTTSGSGNSYVQLYLPFCFTKAARPIDGILDGRGNIITLGAQFSGAALGGTETVNSGYLKMIEDFYTLQPGEEIPKHGKHEFSWMNQSMPSAGELEIKLPTGAGNEYRRLWIFTFDSSGDLSSAEINNINLKSRSFTYADIYSDVLQGINAREARQSSVLAGCYALDLVTDGRLSERVPAEGELILTANVATTGGTIHVIAEKAVGPFYA